MAKRPDGLRCGSRGFPRASRQGQGALAEHRALNVPQTAPREFRARVSDEQRSGKAWDCSFPRALAAEQLCLGSGTLHRAHKGTSQPPVTSGLWMALQAKEFLLLRFPAAAARSRWARSPWGQCALTGLKLLQLHGTVTRSSPSTGRRL